MLAVVNESSSGEIAAGEGADKSIEISNVSPLSVSVSQVKGCCVEARRLRVVVEFAVSYIAAVSMPIA